MRCRGVHGDGHVPGGGDTTSVETLIYTYVSSATARVRSTRCRSFTSISTSGSIQNFELAISPFPGPFVTFSLALLLPCASVPCLYLYSALSRRHLSSAPAATLLKHVSWQPLRNNITTSPRHPVRASTTTGYELYLVPTEWPTCRGPGENTCSGSRATLASGPCSSSAIVRTTLVLPISTAGTSI